MSFPNNRVIDQTIGDLFATAAMVNEFKATMSAEDFLAVYESGGMTGLKYRAMMFKTIISGLSVSMATVWGAATAEMKRFLVSIMAISLGMFLGTTSSKRVLWKNMEAHMTNRTVKNDLMAITWDILDKEFCTYVNGEVVGKTPSLKYPSCMADFCMIGICMLYSTQVSVNELKDNFLNADGSVKEYDSWPELFQKQFIGNFHLDDPFQNEHKKWEKNFWEVTVEKTANQSNKDFKKEFKEEFYSNTAADNMQLLSHELVRVTPGGGKYTKTEITNFILAMTSLFIRTAINNALPSAVNDFAANGTEAVTAGPMTVANYITSAAFHGVDMPRVGHTTLVVTNAPVPPAAPPAAPGAGTTP